MTHTCPYGSIHRTLDPLSNAGEWFYADHPCGGPTGWLCDRCREDRADARAERIASTLIQPPVPIQDPDATTAALSRTLGREALLISERNELRIRCKSLEDAQTASQQAWAATHASLNAQRESLAKEHAESLARDALAVADDRTRCVPAAKPALPNDAVLERAKHLLKIWRGPSGEGFGWAETTCQAEWLEIAQDCLEREAKLLSLTQAVADAWLSLDPQVPWEGAIDGAMVAAVEEIKRLRAIILKAELWKIAPCCLCGYNGRGYFQPETHACAAIDKAMGEKPCP